MPISQSQATQADPPPTPILKRGWAPGLLLAGTIGSLVATDILIDGLLKHMPWWIPVLLVSAPWILPVSSLLRRAWKEAATRAISLGAGAIVGLTGLWLVYANLSGRTPPHPFPDSLQAVAASNVPILDPTDPNTPPHVKPHDPSPVQNPAAPPKTELLLKKGIQGGMYTAVIRSNPREAGSLFLRAFEQSSNTPLTEDAADPKHQISISTQHPAQYSDRVEETFTTSAQFTLMDGVWGQFYAARLEVWFAPSSGGAPRRLTSQVFKVEGWQR